jgi:hypothetical protein
VRRRELDEYQPAEADLMWPRVIDFLERIVSPRAGGVAFRGSGCSGRLPADGGALSWLTDLRLHLSGPLALACV